MVAAVSINNTESESTNEKDDRVMESAKITNNSQVSSTRELLKRVREAAEEKFAYTQNKNTSPPASSKIVLKGSESPAWHTPITKIKLKQSNNNGLYSTSKLSYKHHDHQRQHQQTRVSAPNKAAAAARSLYDYFVKVRGEYEDFREIEAVRLQRRLEKFSDFPKGSKSHHFEEFEKEIVPWQKDSSTKSCFLCSQDFSLLNRRHHCRLCGRIICHACMENIPIKLQDASAKELKSCSKCHKFLFKKQMTNSAAIVNRTEAQMNILYRKIKSLKEQLLETIPKFNEYLLEESVTEARPLKEWRQDAWTLRDTLILYSVHFRSTIQELCELAEQEALEVPVYRVFAGNLRRAGNEFLQKHMFTLQILDMNAEKEQQSGATSDTPTDSNSTSTSGFKGKFMKLIPSLFTDHSDLSFLEFYTDEGDLIPLQDPQTLQSALTNQESILKEQLEQLEGEQRKSKEWDPSLARAIEEVKKELEKLRKLKR